jgi:hypothetical protein
MKRSWLIHVLIIGSLGSGVLLLFSFVNDFLHLLAHFYLVPLAFAQTLWNVVGLLPTPAALTGLLPYMGSDPILTPSYKPFTFFSVQIVVGLLCLSEAYGLRRRQTWALYAMVLFIPVDFLVQAAHLSAAVRMQWPATTEAHGFPAGLATFLFFARRMILKLCLDTGCAAALLLGGYGDFSISGETAPAVNAPLPLGPFPMPGQVVNHSWVAAPPVEMPVLFANRIVFWSAIACLGALILLILSKPPASASPPTQFDVYGRLLPGFLFASLHYGLVAWHTRRQPERFGLGLACACSLAVSAAGFVTAPVLFLGLFQRPSPQAAAMTAGLLPLAFLTLLFVLGNFVLLFASLRTSWLAREDGVQSPISWTLGFAFPFATLLIIRGILLS